MIYTKRLLEWMENPKECLTKEHIEDCQEKLGEGSCDIASLLKDENVHCCTFKYGFLIFELKSNICYIYVYYRAENSEWSAEDSWDMYIEFLKVNGIDTIRMETTLPPEFWEKSYGFKHSCHIMEKRI